MKQVQPVNRGFFFGGWGRARVEALLVGPIQLRSQNLLAVHGGQHLWRRRFMTPAQGDGDAQGKRSQGKNCGKTPNPNHLYSTR